MEINIDFQNKILKKVRERAKNDRTIQEAFEKYDVDIEEIDYLPMCFMDLDVSARTQHGIIYFNLKLLEDSDPISKLLEYASHELVHVLQQTTGDEPTEGSNSSDDYLKSPEEQEGFQFQTKHISRTKGPEKAEEYIDRVLDHHNVDEDEKEDKKEDLLRTAETHFYDDYSDVRDSKQLSLDFKKEDKRSKERKLDIEEIKRKINKAIEEGEEHKINETYVKRHSRPLPKRDDEYTRKQLSKSYRKIVNKNASVTLDDFWTTCEDCKQSIHDCYCPPYQNSKNIFHHDKCANCGHIEGLHLGVPGIEEWCVSCNCIEYKKPVVIDDIKD